MTPSKPILIIIILALVLVVSGCTEEKHDEVKSIDFIYECKSPEMERLKVVCYIVSPNAYTKPDIWEINYDFWGLSDFEFRSSYWDSNSTEYSRIDDAFEWSLRNNIYCHREGKPYKFPNSKISYVVRCES